MRTFVNSEDQDDMQNNYAAFHQDLQSVKVKKIFRQNKRNLIPLKPF